MMLAQWSHLAFGPAQLPQPFFAVKERQIGHSKSAKIT